MNCSSSLKWVLLIPFSVSFLFATANNYEAGPSLSDEDIAEIDSDTTKEEIEEKNGPPTYRCFRSNGHNICYFHQKKKNGEPTQQRQVEINFNEDGTVSELSVYDLH